MVKKIILWSIVSLLSLIPKDLMADENPAITLSTPYPGISFFLGSVEGGEVKVDFGNGKLVDYTLSANDTIQVVGQVAKDSPVRVYALPSVINSIQCIGFRLDNVSFSGCNNLQYIILRHDSIPELDVSNQPNLVYLDCQDNLLKKLDVSNNPNLQFLLAFSNPDMQTLDLSRNTALKVVDIHRNMNIRSLNVSMLKDLERLSVDQTGLYSLDVTNNTSLKILNVSNCMIRSIDLSKNTLLQELYLTQQPGPYPTLGSLDVSHMPDLKILFCSGQKLKKLDMTKNPLLESLFCSNNDLDTLLLGDSPNLIQLVCWKNRLNFNTLPDAQKYPMLNYYSCIPQKEINVDSPEVAVGSSLNLQPQTYNNNSITAYTVKVINSDDPGQATLLEEGVDYRVSNGVFTFMKAQRDSVCIEAMNDKFVGLILKTTKFMVLDPADINKPSLAYSFKTSKNVGDDISITMTAHKANSTVKVDFGDGELKDYIINTYASQWGGGLIYGKLSGDTVRVYTTSGVQLKSVTINNNNITDFRLNRQHTLQQLDLSKNELKELDLKGCRNIQKLVLSKNKLESFDVSTNRILTSIDVSENQLDTLDVTYHEFLTVLAAANNRLKHIVMDRCPSIVTLTLNDNELEELNLFRLLELTSLNINNNKFSRIDLSRNEKLNLVRLSDNYFKFSTLPNTNAKNISYQPQHLIELSKNASLVDLSSEAVIDGVATIYTWYDKKGRTLSAGTDYSIENGVTTFLSSNLDSVYCQMTNTKWPDLTLKTTYTKPSDRPDELLAQLDATDEAGKAFILSLAANIPGYIYADYGDNVLQQLELGTTYRLFEATLGSSKTVKFYKYSSSPIQLTVFSVKNLMMSNADVSRLAKLQTLGLYVAGLKSVNVSGNVSLKELALPQNRLSDIDLGKNADLIMLNLSGNNFETVDLSNQKKLSYLFLVENKLKSIDLSAQTNLRQLAVSGNWLTELDLRNSADLDEVHAANNLLKRIDLSSQKQVNVCDLSYNYFMFSTLPTRSINYFLYTPQEEVEIKGGSHQIDLSSEYNVNGYETTFLWKNEQGGELVTGTDYVVNNGVTTFLKQPVGKVYCEMTNDLFPQLTLVTNAVSVVTSGVSDVRTESDIVAGKGFVTVNASQGSTVRAYNANGQMCSSAVLSNGSARLSLPAGIYTIEISNAGERTVKSVLVR